MYGTVHRKGNVEQKLVIISPFKRYRTANGETVTVRVWRLTGAGYLLMRRHRMYVSIYLNTTVHSGVQ